MLQTYFGGFKAGRLQRLPFLGYSVFLGALFFAFTFATVAAIAGAEHAIGGNLAEAQDQIRNALAIPYIIIFAIVIIMLFIASINIIAKRARDMGLSGWFFVAGFATISLLISWLFSQNASQSISVIVCISLLFVPGNTFKWS